MATLAQVATFLKATPSSYDSLTTAQKADLRDTLAPKLAGFDGAQRTWFKDWWLACTQVQIDAINATLPAKTRVSGILSGGVWYLNIDLATDCLQAGNTYFASRSILRTLVCTYVPGLQPPAVAGP
jgi:hypothetical protein